MKYPPVLDKKVIITGCSSGIGAATARVLRDHGWLVIPTARKAEDLEALKKEGFTPVDLDIAHAESVHRAADQALELLDGTVGGLVNNAGFGQVGAVEDVSRDALRYQFEVNVFGMHELTCRLIPRMRSQGWGRIVNISSVYGLVTGPLVGSYCASKYAMESLSDALRMELREAGIGVSLVEPGPIVSEFGRNALKNAESSLDVGRSRFDEWYTRTILRQAKHKTKPFTGPPEAVACKIRHALEAPSPKIRYPVTLPAYAGAFARRFLPAWILDRILAGRIPL